MKKILVLPLLLCLIFCSFLSLDKNLDEFNPDRIAYGSYGHMAVSGSYASSDKAALPQQEVLDSRAVLYSKSAKAVRIAGFLVWAVVTKGCGSMAIPFSVLEIAATHSECSLFHSMVTSFSGSIPFADKI